MSPSSDTRLPPEVLHKIDQLCNAFEAAWRQGRPPTIEDCLDSVPPAARLVLLEELLRTELEWRWRRGEQPTAEEYQTRFPDCAAFLAEWLAEARSAAEVAHGETATLPPKVTPTEASTQSPAAVPTPPAGNAPSTVVPGPAPETPPQQRTGPSCAFRARPVQVHGYEVLGVLGEGGMGVVFKARHRALNRLVALKMIRHAAYAGEQELHRFAAEAQAIARLSHPNVVQIYDVGEHDGLPYLALEFCPGGSLAHKLRGTPLPADEAAELTEVLARAVHAAHLKGVLHRDLKPANVLLSEDGTPKVTDFGLAKCLDQQGPTRTGVVIGTPSYMAPEQASGRKDIGPATDVWALGATLYELLTGRPPFKAPTDLDTILQMLDTEPSPPSRLNDSVPPALEEICLRCLEKDPARRYPSALALAEDLQRFRQGTEVTTRSGQKGQGSARSAAKQGRKGITASLEAKIGKMGCSITATVALVLVCLPVVLLLRSPAEDTKMAPHRAETVLFAAPRFKGDITALLTSKDDGKYNLSLRDPDALPARDGYQWRLEARIEPEAFLYIFAVDENGQAAPWYPWQPGKWGTRPAEERRVRSLSLPEDKDKGWAITGPKEGMNALIMLARETPLDLTDEALQALLAGIPPQRPFPSRKAAIWLEDGQEVRDEPDRLRTFGTQEVGLDSPIGRLQQLIREKLRPHASYTRAVLFTKAAK